MVGVSEFWPILSDLFPEAVFEKNFTVAMQIAAEKEKEASANAEVKAKEAEETWAKLGDKLSSFWGGEGDEKKEGGDEAAAADKKEDADKKEEGDKKVMIDRGMESYMTRPRHCCFARPSMPYKSGFFDFFQTLAIYSYHIYC